MNEPSARRAAVDDSATVARLLDDFNTEYDTPTPGVSVIESRLRTLLAEDSTFALLAGDPPCAVALVTLRPNVWFTGPVALLDELYVAPAQRGNRLGSAMVSLLRTECRLRGVALIEVNVDEGDVDALRFYDRHGFVLVQPDTSERAFYLSLELDSPV
ncbi:MAG TPA: GNAT family N-acetyltransferase [Microbacterium sp.]|nr:GNAT family N-acetyltransferase [Microbacterium sp.]